MLRKSFIFLFLFSCAVEAQDNCAYLSEIKKILKTNPTQSAEEYIYTKEGHFLSVGNGYGPARPGFESAEEMICVMQNHGFDMIWAGGDVMGCKNQRALGQEIEIYAQKYNQRVKANLIKQGRYLCAL